jgi:hypothetical protein
LLPLTPAAARAAQRIESLGGGRCADASNGDDAILNLRATVSTSSSSPNGREPDGVGIPDPLQWRQGETVKKAV